LWWIPDTWFGNTGDPPITVLQQLGQTVCSGLAFSFFDSGNINGIVAFVISAGLIGLSMR